jgi:hypothetical protein
MLPGAFQIGARVANLYKVHLNLKVSFEGWQPFNPPRQFEMHPRYPTGKKCGTILSVGFISTCLM